MLTELRKKSVRTGVVVAGLLLVGCSSAKISLAPDEIESLRITEVRVSVAPGANIQWDEEASYYLRKVKGVKPPQGGRGASTIDDNPEYSKQKKQYFTALKSPETQSYLRRTFAAKVKQATGSAVASWPNGTRSARLNVVIQGAREASVAFQVLVGPTNSSMSADVTLVDARSGAQFGKTTRLVGVSGEAGGLLGVAIAAARSPKMDRVVASFAGNVKSWLGAKR